MKTWAEFKRQLRVGLVMHCEHHLRPEISGPREIIRVQTNAIEYRWGPDMSKTGWMHFPKASEVMVSGTSATFPIPGQNRPCFTYSIAEV